MTDEQLNIALFYAFRYALGRMTYATYDVAELLLEYKDRLTSVNKEIIKREIERAIETGNAGMDCDIDSWVKVRGNL